MEDYGLKTMEVAGVKSKILNKFLFIIKKYFKIEFKAQKQFNTSKYNFLLIYILIFRCFLLNHITDPHQCFTPLNLGQ